MQITIGNYYFNRGNAKSKLDDKKGAIADWKKAAALYQEQKKTDRYQDAIQSISHRERYANEEVK
jgi:hypothetical protein